MLLFASLVAGDSRPPYLAATASKTRAMA